MIFVFKVFKTLKNVYNLYIYLMDVIRCLFSKDLAKILFWRFQKTCCFYYSQFWQYSMQPCSGVCFFMISSCCNIFCSNIIESTSCLVSEFIIKSTCCDENTFSIRKKCDKNWTEIKLINNLLCFLTEINCRIFFRNGLFVLTICTKFQKYIWFLTTQTGKG
jgi:hypothetical protein